MRPDLDPRGGGTRALDRKGTKKCRVQGQAEGFEGFLQKLAIGALSRRIFLPELSSAPGEQVQGTLWVDNYISNSNRRFYNYRSQNIVSDKRRPKRKLSNPFPECSCPFFVFFFLLIPRWEIFDFFNKGRRLISGCVTNEDKDWKIRAFGNAEERGN